MKKKGTQKDRVQREKESGLAIAGPFLLKRTYLFLTAEGGAERERM